jgi:hypothetical protein
MRMDPADAPVLLFRDRSHADLNPAHRRLDGKFGRIARELGSNWWIRHGEA